VHALVRYIKNAGWFGWIEVLSFALHGSLLEIPFQAKPVTCSDGVLTMLTRLTEKQTVLATRRSLYACAATHLLTSVHPYTTIYDYSPPQTFPTARLPRYLYAIDLPSVVYMCIL
jgi:hypothetical protein